MDVAVGESVILPCQVQHDPLLDIMFAWYFNGALTDFKKDGSHFEKVGGVSYVTFLISFLLKMPVPLKNIMPIKLVGMISGFWSVLILFLLIPNN
jgi:hypothetical protein